MLIRRENRVIKESISSDVARASELAGRIAEDMDSLQKLIQKINFALIQKMDKPQTEGVMNELESLSRAIFKVVKVFDNSTVFLWSEIDDILNDR